MKKIYYYGLFMAICVMCSLCLASCGDDDPAKPEIVLTEVGGGNSRLAAPGDDMHLEALITAEGLIKRIDIEIHQEESGANEVEFSYTDGKYIGVRQTEFHEHLDIPAGLPLGHYHMHFTVTDQIGQQTTVESEIEMVEEIDHGHDHED